MLKNLTQQSIAISVKNRRMPERKDFFQDLQFFPFLFPKLEPITVEMIQANSTIVIIFECGDSKTVLEVWKWRLATASTWGKMQVEIIWTDKKWQSIYIGKSNFQSTILPTPTCASKSVERCTLQTWLGAQSESMENNLILFRFITKFCWNKASNSRKKSIRVSLQWRYLWVDLDLHHGHHGKSGQKSRSPAWCL